MHNTHRIQIMDWIRNIIKGLRHKREVYQYKSKLRIEGKRHAFGGIQKFIVYSDLRRPTAQLVLAALLCFVIFTPVIKSSFRAHKDSFKLDHERRKFLLELDKQEEMFGKLQAAKRQTENT